jgi:transcription elongation GreA/GreB family factor
LTEHEVTQSNLTLTQKVAERFAEAEARLIDNEIRDQILVTQVADIPTANKINVSSPVTLTKTNIFEQIELMRVALAEQNVEDNLCLFVSPSAQSLLLQSGLLDNTEK